MDKKLEVFDSSVENMSELAFRTSLKSALKQDGMGFKVVIWRKTVPQNVPQNKTALRARRVLEFLISQPTISTEEIGKQLGVISCKSSIL